MGWGSIVNAKMYFSRQSFESKEALEQEIKAKEDWLEKQKQLLLLLVSGKTIVPEDEEPIYYIANKYDELMEGILEDQSEIARLYIWLDNFENTEKDEY